MIALFIGVVMLVVGITIGFMFGKESVYIELDRAGAIRRHPATRSKRC